MNSREKEPSKRRGRVNKKENKKKRFWHNSRLRKILRLLVIILLAILVANWLYTAYITITTIRIDDVLENHEDMVQMMEKEGVRKTAIVYEDTFIEGERNLFILVLIFNTQSTEFLAYYFPSDLHLVDSFHNQYISVANLTYAGETYFYDEKYAYVIRQISDVTGMNFDSYIWIGSDMARNFFASETDWDSQEEGALDIFSRLSAPRLLWSYRQADIIADSMYSNMNFVEIYRYFQRIRAVASSGNYEYIDLGHEHMSNQVELDTGNELKVFDFNAFDKSVNENYRILMCRNLDREHVKVEVYNASDIPMYARRVARNIHNSGCNVVRYSNSPETYEKNYIYIPDRESYAVSLSRIVSIIDDPVIVEDRPDFLTTGDIVVVLGAEKNEVF